MMGILIWGGIGLISMWILKRILNVKIRTYGDLVAISVIMIICVITGPLVMLLVLFAITERKNLINRKLPWVKEDE